MADLSTEWSVSRDLGVDANILIRAVLGRKARRLLGTYFARSRFLVADTVVAEAAKYVPDLIVSRGTAASDSAPLDDLSGFLTVVPHDVYSPYEATARRRLRGRDPDDWPVLAVALAFDCPIWTEDRDFFGTGVATWTTDRVELFWSDPVA